LGKKLKDLAKLVDGELIGDGNIKIESAAPIEKAAKGQITFLANSKYKKYLKTTKASAIVLSVNTEFNNIPVIRHKDPYYAFAQILDILYPDESTEVGIDQTAVISDRVKIDKNCCIGALVYIGKDSKIGKNCRIMPQVHIGKKVKLGDNCKIYPGVSILDRTIIGNNTTIHSGTVIGSDGFGYAQHEKGIKKVKQVGYVEIGHDVELGANVTVDRGALGPTKIGNYVKIDNLVQVAHNVEIGDYSIIVSQTGISGSTKLGKGVILAGQVGLVGHLDIGNGVKVGAQSGVAKDIPAGKTYFGTPAIDISQRLRIESIINRLPELIKRIRALEKKK
jgi:UDP-3-O-[3-hydroxymyristoyl] glucosamine N-acyltransferase